MNNLSEPINITNGPKGIHDRFVKFMGLIFGTTTRFGELAVSGTIKYYFFLLAVVMVVINFRLQNSRIGCAWEAIREDEWASAPWASNTTNMKLLAFAMGASFGGVAGGMFSAIQLHQPGKLCPDRVRDGIWRWWCWAAWANISAVLGAVLLSFVPELLLIRDACTKRACSESRSSRAISAHAAVGPAMVVMMLYRPAGLLPSAIRKRELARKDEDRPCPPSSKSRTSKRFRRPHGLCPCELFRG